MHNVMMTRRALPDTAAVRALLALGLTGASCVSAPRLPDDHPGLMQHTTRCVAALEIGDYERAERECELCLEFDERTPECLNGLGLAHYARGDDEEARTLFKHCLRENNDMAQCWNNLAVLELDAGRYDDAATWFARSIEIDPHYLEGRYNLGLAHLRAAMRERARKRDPHHHIALAEDQYKKLLDIAPQHAPAWRDLGVLASWRAEDAGYVAERDDALRSAELLFRRCVALDSTDGACRASLARVLHGQGRFREAREELERCVVAVADPDPCRREMYTIDNVRLPPPVGP